MTFYSGKEVVSLLVGLLVGSSWLCPGALASTRPHDDIRRPMRVEENTAGLQPQTDLWIKFKTPESLITANIQGASSDVRLAAVTLQGAINQQQRSTRIYLCQSSEDPFWLQRGVPTGIRVTQLGNPTSASNAPNSVLPALLARFGTSLQGAVVTDPSNPDTVNLATTLAGIDDAMVVAPSQEALVRSYGLPILHDFRGDHLKGRLATYQWAVTNLLPRTTKKDLVLLAPGNRGNLRDYVVATKSFVFYLTSTDSKQRVMMDEILQHTAANTPILGYIPHEQPDVAELSRQGHFLNASDYLTNESIWASMPSPKGLHQHKPVAVKAVPNTVYIAFVTSEGDNAQYVEHRMLQLWQDPKFGAIPTGWTIAPGMVEFAPTLLAYFYRHLPRNSELLPGPSGVGYATAEVGRNLTRFAELSGVFARRDDMHTVDYWGAAKDLDTYAQASGVAFISYQKPLAYRAHRGTVLYGQTSDYISSPKTLLQTIEHQADGEATGKPLFLEPLIDAWHITPSDEYRIAKDLVQYGQRTGQKFVFTTPSALALTMQAYHSDSHL